MTKLREIRHYQCWGHLFGSSISSWWSSPTEPCRPVSWWSVRVPVSPHCSGATPGVWSEASLFSGPPGGHSAWNSCEPRRSLRRSSSAQREGDGARCEEMTFCLHRGGCCDCGRRLWGRGGRGCGCCRVNAGSEPAAAALLTLRLLLREGSSLLLLLLMEEEGGSRGAPQAAGRWRETLLRRSVARRPP